MLYDDAERLVAFWIDSMSDCDAAVVPEHTLDKPYGWVFFYQSRAYLATGNPSAMLVGNAPIIVNRFTQQLVPTGTARPIEAYLDEYEARLPPDQLQAKPQIRRRQSTSMDLRSFRRAVRDWTDIDVAAFHLARGIGLIDPRTRFSSEAKHVFWSDNPVGNALYKFLDALADTSVLQKRDEPDFQVRWNDDFRGTWEQGSQ